MFELKNGKLRGVYETDNQVTREAKGKTVGFGAYQLLRLLPSC